MFFKFMIVLLLTSRYSNQLFFENLNLSLIFQQPSYVIDMHLRNFLELYSERQQPFDCLGSTT